MPRATPAPVAAGDDAGPELRVAMVGPVPPSLGGLTPGGVATHQLQLATHLVRPGVRVALLATNLGRRPLGRDAREEVEGSVHLRSRFAPTGGARGFVEPRSLAALRLLPAIAMRVQTGSRRWLGSRKQAVADALAYAAFFAAEQPSVVHVQHSLERAAYARIALGNRSRPPLVVTAHSLFGEHSEDVIHGFMAPNLRSASHVIAVSPTVRDQVTSLGVPAARVTTIPSGVNVDRFQPRESATARAELRIPGDPRIVLFVGNLEPRKNVDHLIRAMSAVRSAVPSALLVVGGTGESAGSQNQEQLLRSLTRELGLTSVVRFLGRVSEADLPRWYAAADVFALPSSSEAQGIVALEAMASARPVVASAVGGLLSAVEDGTTGFLVPVGDVPCLAQRIASLLADDARRRAMGAAARDRVLRIYSWNAAADATIAVYRRVVEAA